MWIHRLPGVDFRAHPEFVDGHLTNCTFRYKCVVVLPAANIYTVQTAARKLVNIRIFFISNTQTGYNKVRGYPNATKVYFVPRFCGYYLIESAYRAAAAIHQGYAI
jgi:hypothetical protein